MSDLVGNSKDGFPYDLVHITFAAFSPRTPTSKQDKNKVLNTSGSGDEDIVTLSSNLIKTLKDLDKSLNKSGSSSESPSAHKRYVYTSSIYADGYVVLVFPFVRLYVRSFVLPSHL